MNFLSGAAALSILSATSLTLAGDLDDAGDATRDGGDSRDDSSDDHDDSEDDSEDYSDASIVLECDACAYVLFRTVLFPWSVPRDVLGSERQSELWYDDYPYARSTGYVGMRYEPPPDTPTDLEPVTTGVEPELSQRWAAQASLEGGANLNGVGRGAVRGRLLMPVPIELEVEGIGLLEQDPSGTDWATLSAARLNWRFAEATRVQFRTGAGLVYWLEDADDNDAEALSEDQRSTYGFDVGYGFDAFVHRPFILSAEGRLGALGNAFTWQARATLGAMFGPVEAYAGYQELNIGGVSLGGPIAGIRAFL